MFHRKMDQIFRDVPNTQCCRYAGKKIKSLTNINAMSYVPVSDFFAEIMSKQWVKSEPQKAEGTNRYTTTKIQERTTSSKHNELSW